MKHLLKALCGLPVLARDGQAGTLADVYFHDRLWVVRALVVEPKDRQARRLLIPVAPLQPTWLELPAIAVNLSLEEIAIVGRTGDLSLRSARSLVGYSAEARDGTAGRCEDVLVDDACWCIAGFVVHSPRVSAGSRALAPAHAVAAIDSVNRTLRLRLTRAQVARLQAPAPLNVAE